VAPNDGVVASAAWGATIAGAVGIAGELSKVFMERRGVCSVEWRVVVSLLSF
jgi:hypothetical protein